MTTVFIKGLGLIGSSLARAIKAAHPEVQVTGSDVNTAAIDYALAHGIIDNGASDLDGVTTADYVILATPISQILADISKLAACQLKEDVVITDVGSTKKTIMDAAGQLTAKGITFIGGHPMAGSHKSGVEAGRVDLIENAYYFLIPANKEERVRDLEWLLEGTKAKWLLTTAAKHDLIVTQISDLPHVIAAALVNNTQKTFTDDPLGMRVAAGGFKSVTRIAASNPTMWSAIMMNNQQLISAHLQDYVNDLLKVKQLVDAGTREDLYDFFARAKASRESLNTETKALFYDLFLNIPDGVGEVAKVTRLIADEQISLVNLQILEAREDINGVLQLVFSTEKDRQKAIAVLQDKYELVSR